MVGRVELWVCVITADQLAQMPEIADFSDCGSVCDTADHHSLQMTADH